MSVERFSKAHNSPHAGFAAAFEELRAGRKKSHWVWYIFPQLAGLGHSPTAQFYALRDAAEAGEYFRDPVLRGHLLSLLEVVAEQLGHGIALTELMGGTTDAMKLVSSLTLFERVAPAANQREPTPDFAVVARCCADILEIAQQQGFNRCSLTLSQFN